VACLQPYSSDGMAPRERTIAKYQRHRFREPRSAVLLWCAQRLELRLIQSREGKGVASATPERKLAASSS